jgi:hypothetical protein
MLTATNYTLRNHTFCGPTKLELNAARDCYVKDCQFEDCDIEIINAVNCTVSNCTFIRSKGIIHGGKNVLFLFCSFIECGKVTPRDGAEMIGCYEDGEMML